MDTTSPISLTIAADGSAMASLRGSKLGTIRRVSLVEVLMDTAGSGSIQLQRDGRRLAAKTLGSIMIAGGSIDLYPGQQLDAVITAGPANQPLTIVFHFTDVLEADA